MSDFEFVNIYTNKKFKNRLKYGYLWIFSNEIDKNSAPDKIACVNVHDYKGNFLCKGVYNPHSLISVRVLTTDKKEKIDKFFFQQKILNALYYRENCGINTNCCRIVYGESDLLPGLVIDRYNEVFVVQFFSYGMEIFKDIIFTSIIDSFDPSCIIVRNDFYQRDIEQAPKSKQIIYSKNNNPDFVEIEHLGMKILVDVFNGQKTGFYYDQRDNRKYIREIVKDKKVLDLCCYTGSFSIISALNKSKYVVGVDSSKHAIDIANENAKINNVKVHFVEEKIENFIKLNKEKYDVIIFDPPSYVKSNKDIVKAIKKYKILCSSIINMLNKNGILCLSICARHITTQDMKDIIIYSILKNRQKGFILYYGKQSNDHPVYLPMKEETEYLKFISINVN